MPIYNTQSYAVVLGLTPLKIFGKDLQRRKVLFQDQDPTAIIYRKFSGDGVALSYVRMVPGDTNGIDLYCPPDEIWAYSNVAGTVITVEITTEALS